MLSDASHLQQAILIVGGYPSPNPLFVYLVLESLPGKQSSLASSPGSTPQLFSQCLHVARKAGEWSLGTRLVHPMDGVWAQICLMTHY